MPGLGRDAVRSPAAGRMALTEKSGFASALAGNMPCECGAGRRGRTKAGAGARSALQSRTLRSRRRGDRRRRLLSRECGTVRSGRARSDAAGPQRTGNPADAAATAHRHAGADSDGPRRRRRSRARAGSRRGRLSGQAVRAARAAGAHSRAAAARPPVGSRSG